MNNALMQQDQSPSSPSKAPPKTTVGAGPAQADVLHRLTLEALADVDSGQVLPHHVVQAWAASLGTDTARPLPQA